LGHTWEIDVFFGDNEGLIVAEVELASVDEEVKLPDWIYKEVSDDKRYYNSSLCLKPYITW
jgi:adenylate cyclase